MSETTDLIVIAGAVLQGVTPEGEARVLMDTALRIADGVIAEIGDPADLLARYPDLPRHGSAATIAIPGLVNSHHHSGLTPLMMGVPFAPLELWLPQFRAMRGVGQRLDTLYSAIEMLESGTTTVHHIHGGLAGNPEAWHSTSDDVLGAYGEIGMRAGYSFMIRDQHILTYEDDEAVLAALPAAPAAWLRSGLARTDLPIDGLMAFFLELRQRWSEKASDAVRFNLAPANLHWLTDGALEAIFATARSAGANLHMHLVETERQADYARRRFGRSAVAHLEALGCLGPELTLGHGNWMSRDDLDRIAQHRCTICHNASSGLRLGSGIAPVNELRRRGIPVALGIDQSNINDDRDLTQEMRLVWALHRETGMWNDRPSAAEIFRMATETGARTVGFAGEIGTLDPGMKADIVLMDRRKIERPFVDPGVPLAEMVLHRGSKDAIDKVFVGGRLVVESGKVISIDRDGVLGEIRDRLAAPPTPAEAEARTMVAEMMPALEAFHRQHTPAGGYRSYRYNAMGDN
ncbi:MAG: amidohydrolase family protein [Devosia sp.]|nr:amidohydrolase family protein [Devosia sp.]